MNNDVRVPIGDAHYGMIVALPVWIVTSILFTLLDFVGVIDPLLDPVMVAFYPYLLVALFLTIKSTLQ